MPPNRRLTVRLRTDRFRAECLARGLATDTARAAAFGVHRTNLIHAMNRTSSPSGEFVAAVLTRLRACRWDDLFEIAP